MDIPFIFLTRASIAEAFLRMTLLLGLLTNFYHIFKESDYFESLVETCPTRKFVVGAASKYITKKSMYFSKLTKNILTFS